MWKCVCFIFDKHCCRTSIQSNTNPSKTNSCLLRKSISIRIYLLNLSYSIDSKKDEIWDQYFRFMRKWKYFVSLFQRNFHYFSISPHLKPKPLPKQKGFFFHFWFPSTKHQGRWKYVEKTFFLSNKYNIWIYMKIKLKANENSWRTRPRKVHSNHCCQWSSYS